MAGVAPAYPKFTFLDAVGRPLAGGLVYTYQAGTSTPATTYQDYSLGTPNANPVVLDANGQAMIWLSATQTYKFAVHNSSDVLQYSVDNISGTGPATFIQAGTGASIRSWQDKARDIVSIKDFGGAVDGVTDDTAALKAAVTYLVSIGGGTVLIPQGSCLLNGETGADGIVHGVIIPFSAQAQQAADTPIAIKGSGKRTKLLCGSNNMFLVRVSGSHSSVSNLRLDANSKTGCTAIAMVPTTTTGTSTLADQSYNSVRHLVIKGFSEGIVLQCGPGVGGSTSGCYYNEFSDLHIIGNGSGTRGIFLKSGVASAPYASNNRNRFYAVRLNSVNTGVQIDSGDTNDFFGVSFESISAGTTPNATPTAVKVANTDSNGLSAQMNRFFGGAVESSTRHVDNANLNTEFHGFHFDGTKISFTATPRVIVGGYDFSVTPQVMPGYYFQQNSLISGVRSGTMQLTNGLAFDSTSAVLNKYTTGSFTPSFKGASSDPTVSYSDQFGRYIVIGKLCWVFLSLSTTSVSGGSGTLEIGDLPFQVAANSGYSPSIAVGYANSWTTMPRGAVAVSGTTRIRLRSASSSDFSTANISSILTTAALSSAAGANGIGLAFCYETV